MKKIALTLFSVFVLLVSCKCKKTTLAQTESTLVKNEKQKEMESKSAEDLIKEKQDNGTLVEYTANTRGYYLRIKLTQNALAYTENRDTDSFKPIKLTSNQIDELQTLLKQIDLATLEKLKAPTELRHHDGAAHADMKITKNGQEYQSTGFDHGYPPVEIEKFVSKLLSYKKNNN
ncbi:hypothetical protein FLACOL_00784 [Flavobacterium columnare]|uniref:Lipoprotein n=3 Tax=Flavobacterium TaxID=237 RepID=A0ABW8PNS0_9FLAO|nr:hypothetical protein [Flavobacterium columnare]SPE76795.1 hypothetical protein FLACOL_00784 [Flavobacterium columnare]